VTTAAPLAETWKGKPTLFEDLPFHIRAERKDLEGKGIEFKAGPTEIKAEGEERKVAGWGAAAGNVDSGMDRILPGAFRKTISERMPRRLIKLFYQHVEGIGMPEVLEDRDQGLWLEGKIDEGDYFDPFWQRAKSGQLAHLSIGYAPTRSSFVEEDGDVIRELVEVKLFEVSLVYWPMNELAEIASVKSDLAVAHRFVSNPADCAKALDVIERVVGSEGYNKHDANLALRLIGAVRRHTADAGATTSPDGKGDAGATTFAVPEALLSRAVELRTELVGASMRRRLASLQPN
jgi:hypothetical protein